MPVVVSSGRQRVRGRGGICNQLERIQKMRLQITKESCCWTVTSARWWKHCFCWLVSKARNSNKFQMIVGGSRQHEVAANVKVACTMQRLPKSNYLGEKMKLEMQPDEKYWRFCFSKKLGFQPCQFQVQIGVSQSEGGRQWRHNQWMEYSVRHGVFSTLECPNPLVYDNFTSQVTNPWRWIIYVKYINSGKPNNKPSSISL